MNRNYLVWVCILIMIQATSCFTKKPVLNYLSLNNNTAIQAKLSYAEPVLQKGDLISIKVYSDNPAATAMYNQPVVSAPSLGEITTSIVAGTDGYLIDVFGNIQFQGLGKIQVAGLKKSELTELLTNGLRKFLSNPYCVVRLLNYRITIMGDVNHPNTYNIPSERINILEAIGMAGDMTVFGRKDNVTIYRELNGERVIAQLDLTKKDIFASPFFNLQQNDIIIVDHVKQKQQVNDQVTTRNIGIITGVVSTIAIIITAISAIK
jgi:polysaccharide biosynthesis/export protein